LADYFSVLLKIISLIAMICFPNAKINLGLHITEKRSDGFHNIETVFYPIQWKDALEVIENKNWKSSEIRCQLTCYGIEIAGDLQQNLIVKAYNKLAEKFDIPPIQVHLYKNIPMGAGLGGGSSDASFFIQQMNLLFDLKLHEDELLNLASTLGSDCAFFIKNKPMFAFEKGNRFMDCAVDLSNYTIITVFPKIHSNTQLAYSRVIPKKPKTELQQIIQGISVENWRENLVNDFESSVFYHFPEIKKLKDELYDCGALYASLSGSGSAVYGIFDKNNLPDLNQFNLYTLQIS
jgi:4-diphosphocytidyl-2-C-methyl-D-erythritol kinase